MPVYEYKCEGCGVLSELVHGMNESPRRECPQCGAAKLRKVLSTGGVLSSGSSGGEMASPPPSCPVGGGCASGMCGMM